MADKPKSPRCLFIDRMKRDGREKEWFTKLRAVRKEFPDKYFNECSHLVMKEMGYKGPKEERKINEPYLRTMEELQRSKTGDAVRNARDRMQREQQGLPDPEIEEAINSLPPNASNVTETNWVLSHPAMSRKDRQKDKTVSIVLTQKDILDPQNGKCPSQSAANMLQHWVNGPRDFFKAFLAVQKKSVGDSGAGGSKDEANDEDLSSVSDYLSQLKEGNSEDTDEQSL